MPTMQKSMKKIVLILLFLVVIAYAGCAAEEQDKTGIYSSTVTVDRFVLEPDTIELLIKPNTSQPEVDRLGERIKAMPEVEDVVFISQEEELERLREQLGEDEDILPADLAWELPLSYEITLEDEADVEAVAARFAGDPIIDNDPGTTSGIRHNRKAWRLELKSDDTFTLMRDSDEITGTYRIYRDSIALIEESGELGVFEGEITGTTIRFDAFPGTWEKE